MLKLAFIHVRYATESPPFLRLQRVSFSSSAIHPDRECRARRCQRPRVGLRGTSSAASETPAPLCPASNIPASWHTRRRLSTSRTLAHPTRSEVLAASVSSSGVVSGVLGSSSIAPSPSPATHSNRDTKAHTTEPASAPTPDQEMRPRRALFYVPGSDERKLKSSLTLNADTLVYDLEDGVPLDRKGEARHLILDTLEASEHGKAEKAVRINAIGSGLEVDDLNVMLRSKRLQAIVIPKVQSAKDVQFVSRMVDSVCPSVTRANIRLIASIESALGVMNLKEIAQSDPRMDALIFAAEDYCAEMGLIRTSHRSEMAFARQRLVTTACAFGLQAIDLVCLDYKSIQILEEECREAREWGFAGKQAIHPKQIETIQRKFEPSQAEFDWATRILKGYEQHVRKGIGAFSLDGKVIDLPVVKWAERLISRGKKAGLTAST